MAKPHTAADAAQLPLIGFVEYVPVGGDTYRAVQRPPVKMVSITLAAKMTGKSRDSVYRLYERDFIKGDHSTPGKILIDLQSLIAHTEASKEPGWWTKARRKQYRAK